MNISSAAKQSGLTVKTIRFYEEQGLFKANRLENGYRDFSAQDVESMSFLAKTRNLGFALKESESLLLLQKNPHRASKDVKKVLSQHLEDIESKILELEKMKVVLSALYDSCPGDEGADCTILDELSDTFHSNQDDLN
ncbi:MAG: MerR family transcriptional regulator [Saccharospirillaceae bacterium]|nr:MerR family transcriptional regulator [Pseudomonadales bacterium]NRB78173.1 MerR family transcriptional regulator [Saccharospirillaceae bacterium]